MSMFSFMKGKEKNIAQRGCRRSSLNLPRHLASRHFNLSSFSLFISCGLRYIHVVFSLSVFVKERMIEIL